MSGSTAAMLKLILDFQITIMQHLIQIHAKINTPTETTLTLYTNIRVANEAKNILDRVE